MSDQAGTPGNTPGQRGGDARREPGINEAFAQLRDTGHATWAAGSGAFKAFRILLSADMALARSAFGRTLALAGVAIAFGASCWLLLMAALVTWLARGVGLSFPLALLLCALLSAAVTGWAIWMALHYFEHIHLQATRRQLARLGIGEPADTMPDPSSAQPTKSASDQVAAQNQASPAKKNSGAGITPP